MQVTPAVSSAAALGVYDMTYKNFYLLSVVGILAASFYPVSMGARVVSDMILNGTVRGGDYPKYIIPYTPISLALIVGVLLMPLAIRYARRLALPVMSVVSSGVFLLTETLLESKVTVTTSSQRDTRKLANVHVLQTADEQNSHSG